MCSWDKDIMKSISSMFLDSTFPKLANLRECLHQSKSKLLIFKIIQIFLLSINSPTWSVIAKSKKTVISWEIAGYSFLMIFFFEHDQRLSKCVIFLCVIFRRQNWWPRFVKLTRLLEKLFSEPLKRKLSLELCYHHLKRIFTV